MLKLGDRGLLTYTKPSPTDLSGWFHIDALTSDVVDRVGAGDALLAYSSLALKVSGSPVQAAILGSIAAARECELDGNVPVTSADLLARIDQLEREVNYVG